VPNLPHNGLLVSRYLRAGLVACLLVGAVADARAQAVESGTTFRVFLKDGRAVPSYGEYALVGDRLVFMLPIGDGDQPRQLQLMSLSTSSVDIDRTTRYTESMRAARYAATRGEADYAAMTAEVGRSLDELAGVPDPKRRLALAVEARRRLISWSTANHGYRAADVQELAGLFDEVIAELGAKAGESRFAVDLASGPVVPAREALLPSPGLRESIELALAAAGAADVGTERTAILRAALVVVTDAPNAEDLRAAVRRRLDEETAADRAYAQLSADVTTRADAATARADVRSLDALRREVGDRDFALGLRRPQEVHALVDRLDAALVTARARRLALDHYTAARPTFLAYELAVRPVFVGLDGLDPILEAMRDMTGPGLTWLMRADQRLIRLSDELRGVTPPPDLQGVQATLISAVQMALQACAKRRQVLIAPDLAISRDGSAAAAGAQLLAAQARQDLLQALRPPKTP
jgi:hypothetical protein